MNYDLDGVDGGALDDNDSSSVQKSPKVSILEWSGSTDAAGRTIPPIPVRILYRVPDEESHASTTSQVESIFDRTGKQEEEFYSELWVTIEDAILLLGDEICNSLDSEVHHEAVEYLQHCARVDVPCLNLLVNAESVPADIAVVPPSLKVGKLFPGQPWQGSFKVVNSSSVMTEVRVDKEGIVVTPLDQTELKVSSESPFFAHGVEFESTSELIMPHQDVTFSMHLVLDTVGKFKIVVPIVSEIAGSTPMGKLVVIVHVIPPRIRFESPELDIGLLGVGNDRKKSINFTNESEIPLCFSLSTATRVVASSAKKMLVEENGDHDVFKSTEVLRIE